MTTTTALQALNKATAALVGALDRGDRYRTRMGDALQYINEARTALSAPAQDAQAEPAKAATEHDIRYTGVSPHNGEHWYKCVKCGASDWIASYGTEEQLDFFGSPCAARTQPATPADLRVNRSAPTAAQPVAGPTTHDLIVELREALGLFAGAMPRSPKEVWDEAIARVKEMSFNAPQAPALVLLTDAAELLEATQDLLLNVLEAMKTGGWVPTPLQASFWEAVSSTQDAVAKAAGTTPKEQQ